MNIRKAKKSDINSMHQIIKINSPRYPKKLALQELNEMFSDSLHSPTFIVVEDKNEIRAFGGFSRSGADDMICDIFWINTNLEYSGKGFGRKLMEDIINRIKKEKSPKVKMAMLCTKIPNYFKKLGFEKLGKKYDRDYILMKRTIN
ncbi:MAG: GNAT family N-acetyltransferase [Nanoarchaeota archaeon]|nr:GNAT family N-acetyltransferase [Nanoarchaeota archaeon]